jgi:predicted RNase H-like nuclease (RuvC/YqgF family)
MRMSGFRVSGRWVTALALGVAAPALAQTAGNTLVYRCPGNVYTDALSAKEAQDKGCRVIEGAPVTVIQSPKPREGRAVPASGARPAEAKVDPQEQRARDSDARRILEGELKKEEEQLAALHREYNNGEPERRGDERNYQKYLDRVAALKAAIERKESDIAALKRELAKPPR